MEGRKGAPKLLWNAGNVLEGDRWSPRYNGLCDKHNEVGRDLIVNAIAARLSSVLFQVMY